MNRTSALRLVSLGLCLTATAVPASAKLPARDTMPLAMAQQMIDGCIRLAQANNWKLSIAVKDGGDNLLAFARMDGAVLATNDGALQKATTAARLGMATSGVAKFAFDAKTGLPNAAAFVPGNALFAGGLPVRAANGALLGSIGVSGTMPADDERCAQAGIDAVAAELR